MSEISVRALGEEQWQEYRAIRLDALAESPEAFTADHDDEAGYDEGFWRARMRRSRRILAETDGVPVGVVSVGDVEADKNLAELFGLWVRPDCRGTGVAWRLVQAGADQARADERTHLNYWVSTDNGRAVAFASSFGFRPTEHRRPMRVQRADNDDDDTEIAMILALGADPGTV